MKRLLFLIPCLLVFVLNTQWTAHNFGYAKELGEPLFLLGSTPFYQPFAGMNWMYDWSYLYPHAFGGPYTVFPFFALFVLITMRQGNRISGQLGTSRFATPQEIEKMKIYGAKTYQIKIPRIGIGSWKTMPKTIEFGAYIPGGVVLGRFGRRTLYHDGLEHIILFAKSRSGKGVGVIIPTLFRWYESVFVLDIKGENHYFTSGYRKNFLKQRIIYFNPKDKKSACWNPLEEVRVAETDMGDFFLSDIQNIVSILLSKEEGGKESGDNYFEQAGSTLLTCVIAYIIINPEFEGERHLGKVHHVLSEPGASTVECLEKIVAFCETDIAEDNPGFRYKDTIATMAQQMANKADRELSGVVGTATAALNLWYEPLVIEKTKKCEFKIKDLMDHPQAISMYFVIPPSDMDRLRPLVRLFLEMLIKQNLEGNVVTKRAHRCLLLLDELPSIGGMKYLDKATGYTAGYGMKMLFVVQSLKQLQKYYTKENSIYDNCDVKVTFAAGDIETAEHISKLLGKRTIIKKTSSKSGKIFSPTFDGKSESFVEDYREVLLPSEVLQLPDDKSIVIKAGHFPAKTTKIAYYKDREFLRCVEDPVFPGFEVDPKTLQILGQFYEADHKKKEILAAMERGEISKEEAAQEIREVADSPDPWFKKSKIPELSEEHKKALAAIEIPPEVLQKFTGKELREVLGAMLQNALMRAGLEKLDMTAEEIGGEYFKDAIRTAKSSGAEDGYQAGEVPEDEDKAIAPGEAATGVQEAEDEPEVGEENQTPQEGEKEVSDMAKKEETKKGFPEDRLSMLSAVALAGVGLAASGYFPEEEDGEIGEE